MDLKFWIEIVIILILVFVSGFFSASEIAIIAVRKSRIKKLAKSGDSRAAFVEKLKNNPDDFFAIVQIGMTVTASAASALGGATAIIVIKPLISSIPVPAIQRGAESISIIMVVVVISFEIFFKFTNAFHFIYLSSSNPFAISVSHGAGEYEPCFQNNPVPQKFDEPIGDENILVQQLSAD